MNIQNSLEKLGLDEAETKVYMHLLSKSAKDDANTAFGIASAVKLPRSTVYLNLDRLEAKQLVSKYKKNNILHFLAENPNRFKIEFKEKMDLLESLLPELMALREQDEFKSSVRTYSGDDGVKTVFEDIYDNPHLKGIKEFHTISNPKLIDHFPKAFPRFVEYKKSLNINTKLIAPYEVQFRKEKDYTDDSHRTVRYLPKDFNFEGTIVIYGGKVALFSHRENEIYSIIIESRAIAEMLNAVFLCLWGLLPTANPENNYSPK